MHKAMHNTHYKKRGAVCDLNELAFQVISVSDGKLSYIRKKN